MIVEEESPVAQQVNQMMQNFEMSIMEMEVKKAHPWDVPVKVTAVLYVRRDASCRVTSCNWHSPTAFQLAPRLALRLSLAKSLAFSCSIAFSSALPLLYPQRPSSYARGKTCPSRAASPALLSALKHGRRASVC